MSVWLNRLTQRRPIVAVSADSHAYAWNIDYQEKIVSESKKTVARLQGGYDLDLIISDLRDIPADWPNYFYVLPNSDSDYQHECIPDAFLLENFKKVFSNSAFCVIKVATR